MKVVRDGNDPVFHFQTRGINGLLSLRLWRTDTKEVLWDVNLNYYRERRLRYGEIPTEFRTFNSGLNRASQSYPAGNQQPQPLPPSTTFMVELDCQYDTLLSPAVQPAYFLFSTDAGGALSRVTRPERITANDLPKPKGAG
jgi:hypothetical protein